MRGGCVPPRCARSRYTCRVSERLTTALSETFGSSPLRHPQFRRFYFASIGVAMGYTMTATMAAWLMATMTPSALMVALVQTASTAPAFAVGLLAGSLADIVEKRRVILATQIVFLAGTLLLGIATLAGAMAPWALLALTFLIGMGFTFYMPAQSASINDLVARTEVPQAVALGAVAMNVSRAIGPAAAGAVAAWIGTGSAFLASAACFVGMMFVVRGWPPQPPSLPGVPETLLSGINSGLRFARHSAPMRAIITRNLTFSVCASALWALLPVVARDQLHLGAGGFGLLFGCFGGGAVLGALTIPRHLSRYSLNKVVTGFSLLWVIASTLVAATEITLVALVGAFGAGAAWVGVLASLGAATQSAAPAWVRARAVAMNFFTVQASLALGSIAWGTLASWGGTRIALLASAIALLLLQLVNRWARVRLGRDRDVLPGSQLPEMHIAVEPQPDDGPVLIQIEYRVDDSRREEFLVLMRGMGPVRQRNGATSWRMFRDLAEEGKYVERYILSSWAEYVRLRSRMTIADRQLQEDVAKLQRADTPIRVSRLLGIDLPEPSVDGHVKTHPMH